MFMLKRFSLLLFSLLFFADSYAVYKPAVIDTGRILIGKELYILSPGKEISFQEAVGSSQYVQSSSDVPNLGLSPASIWMRFTINNQTQTEHLLLDIAYTPLDEVELFYSDSMSVQKSRLLGKSKRFKERDYKHTTYIFDLDIPLGASKTYYLRIKGSEQLFLPIYVNEAKDELQSIGSENLISGMYIGVVLIMILYNLFIFFSVKDRSYLYYVIYVTAVGLTQIGLKGFNFQYLWPEKVGFESISIILFGSISSIAALLFTIHFLEIRKHYRKTYYFIVLIILMFLSAIIVTLKGNVPVGFQVMQLATALLSISVFIISLVIMIKGGRAARYFFAAWSILLSGAVIFLLKDTGILPYNMFTSYSMQGASALEMAVLSFGLADRINILKKEKEASQLAALNIAKENEKIIREQNVNLELKVNERTVELKNTNNELNNTLDHLKQAQSQLVESEKMASLGQLTAGIAHEINNPINFVTSNVTPLRRDVAMLFDAISTIEEVGMSDLSPADKQQKIEDYKEELDYDYLKIEINHLLKGIYEGASRTAEIVKGLRIFSRVDEDDLKRADLNEGIDSTIVIINNLLNNKIEIVRHYNDLPLIECYPGKLNQVFLNIISNAIHAVQKQFREHTGGLITISTHSDDKYVFIGIKDNGIGMDEKTKSKVFEPFFTTKDVGEGTGLGMSIAYNTIKKHNGLISVHSAPGQGTEFTIRLPIIFEVQAIV